MEAIEEYQDKEYKMNQWVWCGATESHKLSIKVTGNTPTTGYTNEMLLPISMSTI